MPNNETRALAAMLLGHYPGSFVNEMNVHALAETLERVGLDIAPAVVERAKTDFIKPPSSAQLYEIAREVRAETEPRQALPQMTLVGIEMPEEIRVRVQEMIDPNRKRAEREAAIAEENAEWERKKQAARLARRRTDVCTGTGKDVLELTDGRRVCPDCGVEIPDIIAEPIPKAERRRSWKTGEMA